MAGLQLTFPVFYHCAVKKAGPYTQYNAVNLLLTGSLKGDTVRSIPESTASLYVNGTKPLSKDTIYELLQLPDADLLERFKTLNFSDIFAVTNAVALLLENISITSAARDQLLQHRVPGREYEFLVQVFRTALKNSAFNTARLRKEDLTLIQFCRDPASQAEAEQPPFSLSDRLKPLPISEAALDSELAQIRNIGTFPSPIEYGKTNLSDSYLKFMAELDTDGYANPLDPLGDYEDHLLIRTLYPSAHVSREELLEAFYSLIDSEDEPPLLPIDRADLKTVIQDTDAGDLFVLECMGREAEVLHYLTRQPDLAGTMRAAMISTLSIEASMELLNDLTTAVRESLGYDWLICGARLSADLPEGFVCVRLFLAC